MPRCAFLTISNTKGWFIDDDLVHPPLRDLGWEVENVAWNKPTNWNAYDVVIVRSTWDYQDHLERFIEVLEEIDRSGAILLNSLIIMLWGIDKNYLFDLGSKGVKLVPTIKKQGYNTSDIEESFQKFQTEELIIKPVLGANAYDTFRLRSDTLGNLERIRSVFQDRAYLIQPFIKNIINEGEYSLIYFNGKWSHTILKTVGKGDFRVQQEHGGDVIPIDRYHNNMITLADAIVAVLPETPFYARVDIVRMDDDTFALMELEVVEPSLYFKYGPGSAKAFARCIDNYLRKKN